MGQPPGASSGAAGSNGLIETKAVSGRPASAGSMTAAYPLIRPRRSRRRTRWWVANTDSPVCLASSVKLIRPSRHSSPRIAASLHKDATKFIAAFGFNASGISFHSVENTSQPTRRPREEQPSAAQSIKRDRRSRRTQAKACIESGDETLLKMSRSYNVSGWTMRGSYKPHVVASCRLPALQFWGLTFEVEAQLLAGAKYNWKNFYEVFSACRRCLKSTTFLVSLRKYDHNGNFNEPDALVKCPVALNTFFEVERFISLRDNVKEKSPEHVSGEIERVFNEGAACLFYRVL